MKALTLIRPWPYAIFWPEKSWKDIENRNWPLPAKMYGQTVAIHAGKKFDSEAAEELCMRFGFHPDGDVPRGWKDEGIIGTVTLVGDLTASDYAAAGCKPGPWFVGEHGFLLDDRHRLATPVPCRGALGFWELPPDVEARVREGLRP